MSWRPWPNTETGGLARYVLPGAATELRVPLQPAEIPRDATSRRALIGTIYQALVERGITYRLEEYEPQADRQRIRPPREILDAPAVGTCLDLAALFCAICLGHNLLPLLIVLNDHAFAAVSLTHNRSEARNRTRKDRALFEHGVLRAANTEELRRLLAEVGGPFVPVECTGFSRSTSLDPLRPEGSGRDGGGFLPFARAIDAAREQLSTPGWQLRFAIDVANLHNSGYVPPPPLGEIEELADVHIYGGATALRVNYGVKAADILQYYEKRFVGREKEQHAVFEFVRGSGPYQASSYLLVEAPGGLGKSAFMVSLVETRAVLAVGGPTSARRLFLRQATGGRGHSGGVPSGGQQPAPG